MRAALHFREDVAAGVLERNIQILSKARVRGNRFKQPRRDAIRVAVKKADPVQVLDLR